MSKPNSDLGVNKNDEQYLRNQFPEIADHLIWPKLKHTFLEHEKKANALKAGSRRRSFLAIVLITLSLSATLISTSEPFRDATTGYPSIGNLLTALAVILLIAALLIGKGILFGRKRDDWLKHRLISERIRHFYFQFLLVHVEEICSPSTVERRRILDLRAQALERALRKLNNTAYRQTVRDDTTLQESPLLEPLEWRGAAVDEERYQQMKRFWEELRFNWQTDYSTSALDRKATALPLFGSLADQEHTVSTLEFVATLGIVFFQLLAVISQLFSGGSDTQTQVLVLITGLLAISVVGLQAYRDGMGLTNDLLRNSAYATYSAKLTQDFKTAELKGDRRAEFHAMSEMETLAYFETREFLNAHSRAQFSL